MTKSIKIDTESQNSVQLVSRDDVIKEFGESAASAFKDPIVSWAKFVLTDDRPNANKERIPSEEFDNIVSTGFHKPFKMAIGKINDGHDDAEPIGVITHLSKEGNKVVALAALWSAERPEDVQMIKERIESDKPVNVSWEVYYGSRREEGGIVDLLDTTLRAVTIVGIPAYAGRTPVLAVAAKKWSPAYIEQLPDTSFMHVSNNGERKFAFRDQDGHIDPKRFDDILEEISASTLPENQKKTYRHQLKKLTSMFKSDASIQEIVGDVDIKLEDELENIKEFQDKISDLEVKLALANEKLETTETELAKLAEEKKEVEENLIKLEEEINPLREFKSQVDEQAEKAAKLEEIKVKFKDAGLEKDEQYFEENSERLLGLDQNALDFMLQEMVAFNKSEGESESSNRSVRVPNFSGKSGDVSISDMVKALKERKSK